MVSRIRVEVSGPLFDGRAKTVINAFMDEAKERVAQIGVDEVHARLGRVLRHPTGVYQSRVVRERAGRFNDQVIHDQGIVYGPWLEGVSRRNQRTRFKGYATFRRVRLRLRKTATPEVEKILQRYLARLNS